MNEVDKKWALTGGIATGKSTAARIFRRLLPSIGWFDCDQAVGKLWQREEVLDEVSEALGESVRNEAGEFDRARLRVLVFGDEEKRLQVEKVLHPKVRKECLEQMEIYGQTAQATLFLAEVPLLFEGGFDFGQTCNLVVATSPETQRVRLKARNQFDDQLITKILQTQLPIMEKLKLGDVIFWNEGKEVILEKQINRLIESYQFL